MICELGVQVFRPYLRMMDHGCRETHIDRRISSRRAGRVDVNTRQAVRASLSLLTHRDQRKLVLVTMVQMATGFLDLAGVLLLGIVTALSVSAMSGVPAPAVAQRVLDVLGLGGRSTVDVAIFLAVVAGVVLTLKSAISVVLTRRTLRFLAFRQAMVSGRLVRSLLALPLMRLQSRSSQQSAYALTSGVSQAMLLILGQAVIVVSEVALLVILSLGLLLISPVVTIFAVAFFVVIGLFLQRMLSGWAGRLGSRSSEAEIASYSAVQEALVTYREVVVGDRRDAYVKRFQGLRWETALVQSDIQFMGLLPKYVFEVALILGAAVLAASQFMTRDVTAAVGVIAVFLAAGSRIVPSMLRMQGALLSIRAAAGQAAPTFELAAELEGADLGAPRAISAMACSDELLRRIRSGHRGFEPRIDVVDVSVSYPGSDSKALSRVSLTMPEGSSLGLVGTTGAGKSTLADVILGILPPDSGYVRIGGVSPDEAIATWPGALAYVPQEIAITNSTIRENVALGLAPDMVDDALVWEALERAHLAGMIEGLREGLDSLVGEHGVKMSGGQRQRLGLARALYTRPRLLVLDEATSALDAETEQIIATALRELEGAVTTVTVAHRLATIRHCDIVLYLEMGRPVAFGTFEEVRNQSVHFDQQAKLLGL